MNISTNTPTARIVNNTIDELLAKLLDILGFNNSSPTISNMSQPLTIPIALNTSGPVPYIFGPVGYYPTQLAQPAQPTYMTHQVQSGSTMSMVSSGQATVMPYAFTTGTLHDPASGAWNFDTGGEVLRRLVSSNFISCNKEKPPVLCHACQLGKHVRLPFVSSGTVISSCFDIIHSDVWTSPIPNLSGFKYYVLFLDHYSQFVWVYPLVNKSDVMSKFMLFRNYVRTQFKCEIKSFQCDHGGEFDNSRLHTLFAENGIQFRFSCPQTSQQNRKSERMVRTIKTSFAPSFSKKTSTKLLGRSS
uniref:Ribonuclease H-like domain-containing protein n=1 Tax=Tanacetum cinerariifolium TaxID=118510 RepID=A0A6L2KLZ1_TANCI|nr:ribonuclease H-like domain-containing protein [Tanacetum cinerariifolium]